MANILYRGSTPSSQNASSGGVNRPLSNDEIDKNFYALKTEVEGDNLLAVTQKGSSTTVGVSLTGNNTIGNTSGTTTFWGTLYLNTITTSPNYNIADISIKARDGASNMGSAITIDAGSGDTVGGNVTITAGSRFGVAGASLLLRGAGAGHGASLGVPTRNNQGYGAGIYHDYTDGYTSVRGAAAPLNSTNTQGGYVSIDAGFGTGNAASGTIRFRTHPEGLSASGTANNNTALRNSAIISGAGTLTLGTADKGGGKIIFYGGNETASTAAEIRASSGGSLGMYTSVAGLVFYNGLDFFAAISKTYGIESGDTQLGGGKLTAYGTDGGKIVLTPSVNGASTNSIIDSGLGIDFRLNNQTTVHARLTTTNFTHVGDIVSYGSLSDINLKENLVQITDGLERVKNLNGYVFNYKGRPEKMIGVVAQELEKVAPELVFEKEDLDTGEITKVVRYSQITAILIEAIKELSTKVEDLQNQLNNK